MMKPGQSEPVDGGFRAFVSMVDLKDLMALGGAGMVFYGLHLIHVPSAYVATGGLLILAAVAATFRRPRS